MCVLFWSSGIIITGGMGSLPREGARQILTRPFFDQTLTYSILAFVHWWTHITLLCFSRRLNISVKIIHFYSRFILKVFTFYLKLRLKIIHVAGVSSCWNFLIDRKTRADQNFQFYDTSRGGARSNRLIDILLLNNIRYLVFLTLLVTYYTHVVSSKVDFNYFLKI